MTWVFALGRFVRGCISMHLNMLAWAVTKLADRMAGIRPSEVSDNQSEVSNYEWNPETPTYNKRTVRSVQGGAADAPRLAPANNNGGESRRDAAG